jgi:hypothetical protein
MRFADYALLLFAMMVVFYFVGIQQPLIGVSQAADYSNTTAKTTQYLKLNCVADAAAYSPSSTGIAGGALTCNDTFFGVLALLLVVGGFGILVLALAGFSAMYVIPAVMIFVFLNLFVFPLSSILNPALVAPELGYAFVALMNMLTVLALFNFIRGAT